MGYLMAPISHGAGMRTEMGRNRTYPRNPRAKEPAMDWKIELIAVPVSDVDRAKSFYAEQVGFSVDHDHTVSDEVRFVQLTPPGSACSIAIGMGLTDAAPGSLNGVQMVVADIEQAHERLVSGGVEPSEIQDFPWGRFVFFSDPDGNRWAIQQLPQWASQ
jgi:predicted enzyme related to lactoylglutathione lyase